MKKTILMGLIVVMAAFVIADVVYEDGSLDVPENLVIDSNTFYVDSTNDRVGIGTNAPSNKLDVFTASQYEGITLRNSSGAILHNIYPNDAGVAEGAYAQYYNNAIKNLFAANGNSYITGGNVGIGTTTPQTNVFLQVAGEVRVGSGNSDGLIGLGGSGAGDTTNVGIARGSQNAVSGGNWLNLGGYSGINFAASSHPVGSQTSRMTIDGTTGNVGIGTTIPNTRLEIKKRDESVAAASSKTAVNSHIRVWDDSSKPIAEYVGYLANATWYGGYNDNVTLIGFKSLLGNHESWGRPKHVIGFYSNFDTNTHYQSYQNYYGLYLDNMTKNETAVIQNIYGIYQADSNAINYFNGKIGIGTIPNASLTVASGGTTVADEWFVRSDRDLKTNIEDFSVALLDRPFAQTYTYKMKDQKSEIFHFGLMIDEAPTEIVQNGRIGTYAFSTYNYKLIEELFQENLALHSQLEMVSTVVEEQNTQIDILKIELCNKDGSYSFCSKEPITLGYGYE